MKRLVVPALLLVAALPASAGSTWTASEGDADTAARADDYDRAMKDGDKQAILAASESTSASRMKKLVLAAAREYELASSARPDLAEPHWRAANVLYGFFYDCAAGYGATALCLDGNGPPDAKLARRIIAHWDAIEEIDPLDPRMGAGHFGAGVLFQRAILRTKLATDADLEASVADYEKWLDRSSKDDINRGLVVGNLAEGYMMIGDLEKSIVTFREALEYRQDTSLYYGLAVAYDRDGQGKKARELIKALGTEQFDDWAKKVAEGDTFYVPAGEVFYYLGLAREALGDPKTAIKDYRRFIDSGAHPRYHERAKENMDALRASQANE